MNSVTTMDLENRVQKIEVVKNLSPRKVIKTEILVNLKQFQKKQPQQQDHE